MRNFALAGIAGVLALAAHGVDAAPVDDARNRFQAIASGDLLTFRDGKIVNEVWQIDPKLAVASAH